MPSLNPSVGLLVSVVSVPWVTDTVTSPDSSAELAVNSIISSVVPPDTGTATLPWYWKSVRVADPAVSTEAALEAVPPGAVASLGSTFLALAPADLPPPADEALGDGEALGAVEGVGVADGASVPDWPAEGVGDGLAEADDDTLGVGLGAAVELVGVGVGVGVGDADGGQRMPRMHPPAGSADAALATPPVPSMPATSRAGNAATASVRCAAESPAGRPPSGPAASSAIVAVPSHCARGSVIRSRPADRSGSAGASSSARSAGASSSGRSSSGRSAGASSRAGPEGAASTDWGSAGTQAKASAPPMIASSMPRTNPPRLDAGNEMMPSTIPAMP
jgi:hypothetical protein